MLIDESIRRKELEDDYPGNGQERSGTSPKRPRLAIVTRRVRTTIPTSDERLRGVISSINA